MGHPRNWSPLPLNGVALPRVIHGGADPPSKEGILVSRTPGAWLRLVALPTVLLGAGVYLGLPQPGPTGLALHPEPSPQGTPASVSAADLPRASQPRPLVRPGPGAHRRSAATPLGALSDGGALDASAHAVPSAASLWPSSGWAWPAQAKLLLIHDAIEHIVREGSTGPVVISTLEALAWDKGFRRSLRWSDRPQMEREAGWLCGIVSWAVPGFTARELCRTVDALVRLARVDAVLRDRLGDEGSSGTLGAISRRVPQVLDALTPRDAARLIWAWAKLGTGCHGLVEAVGVWLVTGSRVRDLTPVQTVMALWGVAKLDVAPRAEGLRDALLAQLRDPAVLDRLDARGIANVAWALARLGIRDLPHLRSLADGALRPEVIAAYNAQDVANTAWAYATLAVRHEALMAALSAQALRKGLGSFKEKELTNTAWGFAVLEVRDPPLMRGIAKHAAARATEFGAQGVANIAWAFAKLRIRDEQLMDALARRTLHGRLLHTFSDQQVACTAWALATLNVRLPLFTARLAEHAASTIATFSPPTLTTAVWAFATLGCKHEPLWQAVARQTRRLKFLTTFQPRHIALTAWAFAKLGILDDALMAALADHAFGVVHQFAARDLATTAWACAALRYHHPLLLDAMARRVVDGEGVLPACNARDIANLAWAFAVLKCPEPLLAIPEHVLQSGLLQSFDAHALANTAWAFAAAGIKPKPLMLAMAERIARDADLLATFDARHLVTVAWAFAKLRSRYPALMAALARQAVQSDAQFNAQGIANMVFAFATLAIRHDPLLTGLAAQFRTATAGNWTAPDLALTLWSYATLGFRDEQMVVHAGRLVRRGVPAFTPLELARTLWALAVFDSQDDAVLGALLERNLGLAAEWQTQRKTLFLRQVHATHVHVLLHPYLRECNSLLVAHHADVARCLAEFTIASHSAGPCPRQLAVWAVLNEMGVAHTPGAVLEEAGGYRVAALIAPAIVVDVHLFADYAQCGGELELKGAARLKVRQLEAFGYYVVAIPFYEWDILPSAEAKREYLSRALDVEKGRWEGPEGPAPLT